MKSPRPQSRVLIGAFSFLALIFTCLGDAPVPGNILEPKTAAEAWNVIRLSTANVERLIEEKRWREIPTQVAFCSPALRTLAHSSESAAVHQITTRTAGWVVAVASAGIERNEVRSRETLSTLEANLRELATHFDPKIVAADIFLCPMHPDFVADQPTTPCAKCGMTLMPRRIPYSFIYMKPGKPSLRLTASADGPIEAGKKVNAKVQLRKGDGSPVHSTDLIVMHTQPIHLLMEDASLSDYHHEHPVATGQPGEYAFTFTPTKTAPYRIWADIVPTATGLQELPFVDLPSAGKGGPIENREDRLSTTVGGLRFQLSFTPGPPRAQHTCGMQIRITHADGEPMRNLEPLMNAFAHLVGFYDDYQTVVHLHPAGGEILQDAARGGPSLVFTFYPPKPGFMRLYCQVQVNDESVFAPFNVNVAP
jgi:hypothetical protein